MFSRSTADLLTVVSDRIASAVALDISKFSTGFGLLVFFTNLSLMEFGLISSFFSNRLLRVVLDMKSSQEYPVNAGVPPGFNLGPTLFIIHYFYYALFTIH